MWNGGGEDADDGDYESFYGNDGQGLNVDSGEGPDVFEDLLDFDPDSGEVYMIVDELPQDSLEETEAIEYAGDYLSWVFFEARDRVKGKGKGKPGKQGKSKSFGKGKGQKGSFGKKPLPPGTFGVYGSYMEHRRALQDARKGRGFDRHGDHRPRLSLEQLQAKSRCHACRQVGHWSRNCPLKGCQRPATAGNQSTAQRPTTAMFFVEPSAQSSGYLTMIAANPTEEQYMSACQPDGLTQQQLSYFCFSSPSQPPPAPDIGDFLSYNFATAIETPGRALVDTAAQHGLIGQETLSKLDQHLANQFGMRIKRTNEDGGTVRGVCGSEERTPIAYVPIGIGGCSGLLRVQIVPGAVPCLLPAYLLTDIWAVLSTW